jgi:hypothetical protein
MSKKELSETMKGLVEFMKRNENKIHRHPGGFWSKKEWASWRGELSYGTSSVDALVKRGVAQYSNWQEGRSGRFPIEATLTG